MKALIDGDIIVYSCGFASEKVTYTVGLITFTSKKEAEEYCLEMGATPSSITKVVVAEPLSHALQTVKKMLERIIAATGADDYEIFLTGEGNYREELATILPYKGNRDPSHKPTHYAEIKNYLLSKWEATVIEGREADDALGCLGYESFLGYGDDVIICTIDKDLDMIPGSHYNWRTGDTRYITLWAANLFFYTQLLTGDRTDNIRGIPGIGPKKAAGLLAHCMDEEELYDEVFRKYMKHTKGDYKQAVKEMAENANLLWIQRKENVLWEPPHE